MPAKSDTPMSSSLRTKIFEKCKAELFEASKCLSGNIIVVLFRLMGSQPWDSERSQHCAKGLREPLAAAACSNTLPSYFKKVKEKG